MKTIPFNLALGVLLTFTTVNADKPVAAPDRSGIPTQGQGTARASGAVATDGKDAEFATLLEAANAGKVEAQMRLATAYSRGLSVKQDQQEAVRWWTRAAGQGEVQAMFLLGLVSEGVTGLHPDATAAMEWYGKAASKGHIHALNRLGGIHLEGKWTARSPEKAFAYFKQAADLGDPGAITQVAIALWEGEGTTRDRAEARRLYRKAAGMGWGSACQNLGLICLQDDALPLDARAWFEKGSTVGDLECTYNLAKMLENGEGGPKDPLRAARLYEAAARGGHGKAMNNYACMLAEGLVIGRDLVEACKWCLIADQLGVQSAGPNFRLYASHLTEAGRTASVARAEAFLRDLRNR